MLFLVSFTGILWDLVKIVKFLVVDSLLMLDVTLHSNGASVVQKLTKDAIANSVWVIPLLK